MRSQQVDLVGILLQRLPRADGALAWVRDGAGLVGWGEAARLEVSGPDRFARARDWWHSLVSTCVVEDEVGVHGSGPVAFGSFSFSPDETSVLVVPEVTLGRRDGATWLTTFGNPPRLASPDPVRRAGGMRYARGQVSVTEFREVVARAVARIDAGDLDKVVLAHDLLAAADQDIDVRFVMAGLTAANPGCWTYAVEGLVGADAQGWWGTGDVAYADEDRDLFLVDRRKELVLVSGFNVYPREVEDAIADHPDVLEVAVIAVAHPVTGEAVKAFVVARPGSTVRAEDVIAHSATRLARFKRPTVVDLVDELPHSATGKVAKGRLREQESQEVLG